MSPSLDRSDDGTDSKCASPADMDESPVDAVFITVWDPGDDAVETTSF